MLAVGLGLPATLTALSSAADGIDPVAVQGLQAVLNNAIWFAGAIGIPIWLIALSVQLSLRARSA